MNYIEFLNTLARDRIPINQAKILFYLQDHPVSMQRDMVKPLGMSKAIICQSMQVLIGKGFVNQSGPSIAKVHSLSERGREVITNLKDESTRQS